MSFIFNSLFIHFYIQDSAAFLCVKGFSLSNRSSLAGPIVWQSWELKYWNHSLFMIVPPSHYRSCIWIMTRAACREERKKDRKFGHQRMGSETQREGSKDRCFPQGEPPLTCLPHKLFSSFRLHSKVVELGYKIISQATCLSSLAVQLANWREWFPVWATIQNMAVKIWMI